MNEQRKRRRIHPLVKGAVSLVAISVLLILSTFAIRFCLGLFMVGDQFILAKPGDIQTMATEPADVPDIPLNTEPAGIREVGRARMLATGDLMMHLPIVRSGLKDDEYSFDYIYEYIRKYVEAADYAVVNLETTLSGTDGNKYTGYPKFNSPDAVAKGAKSGGFDLALTANNHCYDYGSKGLLRTLSVVKDAGLDTLGTYETATEQQYLVKDIGGVKVGMLNYTYGDIGEDPTRPFINGLKTDSAAAGLVNVFSYAKLELFYTEAEEQIAAMKAAGAEAIVLFIHWGDEYSSKINQHQKEIARKMCDLGVDVIAGSHPHVVQGMELLTSTRDAQHQTVVLYSMGNFLSNQRSNNVSLTTGQTEDSLLFTFTFVKYSDGRVVLEDVNLLPTWVLIRGSGDGRSYHILPLDKSVEDWAEAYDLTGTQSVNAHKSYSRTMDTVEESLTEIRELLARQAQQTQPTEPTEAPTEAPEFGADGVG